MEIMREETFGPVLCVMQVETMAEAVEISPGIWVSEGFSNTFCIPTDEGRFEPLDQADAVLETRDAEIRDRASAAPRAHLGDLFPREVDVGAKGLVDTMLGPGLG